MQALNSSHGLIVSLGPMRLSAPLLSSSFLLFFLSLWLLKQRFQECSEKEALKAIICQSLWWCCGMPVCAYGYKIKRFDKSNGSNSNLDHLRPQKILCRLPFKFVGRPQLWYQNGSKSRSLNVLLLWKILLQWELVKDLDERQPEIEYAVGLVIAGEMVSYVTRSSVNLYIFSHRSDPLK